KKAALQIVKQMSGPATVKPGQQVQYTIMVRNTGDAPYTAASPARFTDNLGGLLDDATFNGDAEASFGDISYDAPSLRWSGALKPGQSATITFSVTVKSRPFGDLKLDNQVISSSPGSNCAVGSADPKCETKAKVIAPDKERPRALGQDGLNNGIEDKFRPISDVALEENRNTSWW
ncbi:DUF7927 domain-containing protein, partial [Streptomyces erythrochromogenes]